jgi:hypothetical protein
MGGGGDCIRTQVIMICVWPSIFYCPKKIFDIHFTDLRKVMRRSTSILNIMCVPRRFQVNTHKFRHVNWHDNWGIPKFCHQFEVNDSAELRKPQSLSIFGEKGWTTRYKQGRHGLTRTLDINKCSVCYNTVSYLNIYPIYFNNGKWYPPSCLYKLQISRLSSNVVLDSLCSFLKCYFFPKSYQNKWSKCHHWRPLQVFFFIFFVIIKYHWINKKQPGKAILNVHDKNYWTDTTKIWKESSNKFTNKRYLKLFKSSWITMVLNRQAEHSFIPWRYILCS